MHFFLTVWLPKWLKNGFTASCMKGLTATCILHTLKLLIRFHWIWLSWIADFFSSTDQFHWMRDQPCSLFRTRPDTQQNGEPLGNVGKQFEATALTPNFCPFSSCRQMIPLAFIQGVLAGAHVWRHCGGSYLRFPSVSTSTKLQDAQECPALWSRRWRRWIWLT